MKSKKILGVLLGSSIAVLTLVACGGGEAQKTTTTTSTTTPTSTTPSTTSTTTTEEKKIPGLVEKNIEVTMNSHFGGKEKVEYKDTTKYSDYWFLEDSTTMNHDLAVASAMAAGASYSNKLDNTGTKITAFMEAAGYSNIQKNQYYSEGLKLADSMGLIIGKKQIKNWQNEDYTLLAIFPRNAGYDAEWMGNFDLGSTKAHKGFMEARDEMLRFMKKYMTDNNISGKLKVWIPGYSRGGATANLLGGFLAEDNGYFANVSLSYKDLFVYTIASPATIVSGLTKKDMLSVSGPRGEGHKDTNVAAYTYNGNDAAIDLASNKYKCIHNFIAVGDYITKLPPQNWGFTRYGETISINYGSKEMLDELKKVSPDTASKFSSKNYSTKLATKTVDLNNIKIVETETKLSPDEMIEGRINALLNLAGSRDGYITKGYDKLLGSIASVFGTDFNESVNIFKSNLKTVIPAALLNYLTYATNNLNLSDSEAAAKVVMDIMDFIGKNIQDRTNYTDQQFLKDILDFLINDFQTNDQAKLRTLILSALIPAPYGALYGSIVNYANTKKLKATNVDELIFLVSSFVHENKTETTVDTLLTTIAKVFPSKYIGMISMVTGKTYKAEDYTDETQMNKTAILDAFDTFVEGQKDSEGTVTMQPDDVRSTVYNLANLYLGSKNLTNLGNLLTNGSKSSGSVVTKEPTKLSNLLQDILSLVLAKDKDGNLLTLKASANKYLADLLEKAKNDSNSKYVELLQAKTDDIRDALFTILFNPKENHTLQNDIDNALTFIDTMTFLFPAHFHEMYISAIKTMK